MKEVDNVLRILEETQKAISERNYTLMKSLSNQTINTASLTQDPDNVAVAVAVYSLSKILERNNYKSLPGWKRFYKKLNSALSNSIQDIRKNNLEKFRKDFQLIREHIENLNERLKDNIQEVFRKASINKASRIYEHGISMEQTAKLLGITLYELASYAGGKTPDVPENKTLSARSRIKLAERFFE